jgi:hypothetical protein
VPGKRSPPYELRLCAMIGFVLDLAAVHWFMANALLFHINVIFYFAKPIAFFR